MRTRDSEKTAQDQAVARPVAARAAATPLLGLQATAGNAAVVQMLRQAGELLEEPGQASSVRDVLRRPGRPLDGAVRADMEARLGADFSDVRIHDDGAARASAAGIGARAYTSGSHVVIGDGGGDKHTLAHELTHVIQQRQGPVSGSDNGSGLNVSDPSDRFEREAEANAHRVMSGPTPAQHSGHAGHDDHSGHTHHEEEEGVQRAPAAPATAGAGTAVQRAPGPGIELLKGHDPLPDDTTPLRDWDTLRNAAQQPSALDVHQILLTYQKLSNGWSSGMGEVQQALSNRHGELNNVPQTVVTFGPVVNAGGVLRGTAMRAYPLTSRGAAGSDATTGAYAGLGGAVEGHLLNAHLHGPATPENLAPFSKRLNSKHSKEVEEPLKKMVYNENGTFGYEVVVNGDPNSPLPYSITCHVVELDDTLQQIAGGYELKVELDQQGGVNYLVNRTTDGPDRSEPLDFGRVEQDGLTDELATLWNQLRFPWTREYGDVVREVLETAYQAVGSFETQQYGGTSLANLPRTQVVFETGNFQNIDEDGDLVDEVMGVRMLAEPLTLLAPPGQSGFEPEGGAWGLGAIRGHLLNHHLHGPAEARNLVPMSASLNQQFEREVESPVKRWVLEEGRVLSFEVRMLGSDEQFGMDGVPTTLAYEVHECRQDQGGTWQRAQRLLSGRLSNESDEAYEE
ncbi:DUF4157 domain-containing protein [Kitasatospora sp. NPDC004745]|uniref:eCIS core domain-containing protein n=1 Tax=Kitasatospora sp. NPDC004745 TaxID=3364019 RepID=UPI0036904E2F